MKTRVALQAGVYALVMMTVACGENLTSAPAAGPTGPTTLGPLLLPRVDGLWGGELTLTGIAGGTGPARSAGALECVGAAFDSVILESTTHNLSITQAGTAVTARLTSAGTGLSCNYSGRVGSNGALALDASACDSDVLLLRCQTGEVRQMTLVGSSITATFDAPVNVASLSGTAAHTYHLTGTGGNIGTLVANHSFTNLTRR